MGVRMPGSTSRLFDPRIVEGLIQAEKIPVDKAKERKQQLVTERDEFNKFNQMVNDLDSSLNGIKGRSDFYKLKLESSHPDILDGVVKGIALPGSYEFEVRGLARSEKELAYGFPDKDTTPVGFGFMQVEREDQEPLELTIEPGATLQDVAKMINDSEAGVRAMVINTKYKPDAFRLLVMSEKSGEEARIHIDEDTTFMEFKEQVTGRNLDLLFEDVPITDEDNNLEDLVDGLVFNIKRSEPGTRVQVNVNYDNDATLEGIKGMVEKYNAVMKFVHEEFQVNPETGQAGNLAKESALKSVQRGLQSTITSPVNTGGKYSTLAEIGITTDPKTGTLNLDEAKVKGALAEDYEGVAKLFIKTGQSAGIADRLGQVLKAFRDPASGVMKSRQRGMDEVIKNQDELIKRKEANMAQREESIKRRFTSLEGQLSGLKSQGDYIQARLGGAGGGAAGG